jgi:hypothetical protein
MIAPLKVLQKYAEEKSASRGGRSIGKTVGGIEGGWIGFQESIGVGQFQDAINHAGGARETKRAPRCFQARKTVDEFSQAAAIELGDFGKIDYDARMVIPQQLIKGELQPFALNAHLERSTQLEDDDAGLQLFLFDFHWHLSKRCLILETMAGSIQAQWGESRKVLQAPGAPLAEAASSPS